MNSIRAIAQIIASLRPSPRPPRHCRTLVYACAIVLAMLTSVLCVDECVSREQEVGVSARVRHTRAVSAALSEALPRSARLCVGPRWCRLLCETYGLEDRRTYTGDSCHREPTYEYLAHLGLD
jgi:hypothetical protein